jgi:hypothetical protein
MSDNTHLVETCGVLMEYLMGKTFLFQACGFSVKLLNNSTVFLSLWFVSGKFDSNLWVSK